MSVKLTLYNAIKTKVLAMVDGSSNKIIKTFEHWNNQFDRITEEKQFLFPAVFIEFASIEWKTDVNVSNKTHTQQARGVCNLTIHVGVENKSDEEDSFPVDIAIIDSVYDQLNGLQGVQFTPLKRISESDDVNHDNILHWQVNYETEIHEKGYDENKTDVTEGGETTIGISIIKNYT